MGGDASVLSTAVRSNSCCEAVVGKRGASFCFGVVDSGQVGGGFACGNEFEGGGEEHALDV